MSVWQWADFPKVKTSAELEAYLVGREYNHASFFHYTGASAVNSILKNCEFWLGCASAFNDTYDKDQFKSREKEVYSICFSTGINENLPMWYIYSGIDGMGARLRLTPGTVKNLITEGTYSLYEWDKENYRLGAWVMELVVGETMLYDFRDIIYQEINSQKDIISLKYNTMTNHVMPQSEMNTYVENHPGFKKGLIWYYEKETRLLVQLIGAAKEALQEAKEYKVVIKFSEKILKKLSVTFAPNVVDASRETTLNQYDAIKKLRDSSSQVGLSEFSGSVDFKLKDRLCKECGRKQEALCKNCENRRKELVHA